MRLIKMIGLAAVAAVAAMAFLGASSAMATLNTSLCKVHEEPCAVANQVEEVHFTAGVTTLVTPTLTVLCLSSLFRGKVENGLLATAPTPLKIKGEETTFSNCGTNAEHNNCTVTTEVQPLFDVLKKALNLGEAWTLVGEVHVECSGFINCFYGGEVKGFSVEGALHTAGAGHGMFTATNLVVPKTKGFFCPEESKWTALYEPLEHLYLVS